MVESTLQTAGLFTKPAQERLQKKCEQLRNKFKGRRPDAEPPQLGLIGDSEEVIKSMAFSGNPEIEEVLRADPSTHQAPHNQAEQRNEPAPVEEETKDSSAAASKISEDEMKKKLLEAAAASVAASNASAPEEDAEGLEDMLDDLL